MTISIATQTSLLTATHAQNHVHLILGTNPLAATRCTQSLFAGAVPIVIAAPEPGDSSAGVHYTLQKRIDAGEAKWLRKKFEEKDLFTLGREEVGNVVDAVFVTTSGARDPENAKISALCKRNRIPINVIDSPALCTFALLSVHNDGPLQVGVTTNGRGCKLASRIRREIASSLPPNLGQACARLGAARRRIHQEDRLAHATFERRRHPEHASSSSPVVDPGMGAAAAAAAEGEEEGGGEGEEDETLDQSASFNKLILEQDLDAAKTRRIRWLGQVCEYWPLKRLAEINDQEVEAILATYTSSNSKSNDTASPPDSSITPGKAPLPPPSSSAPVAGGSASTSASTPKLGRIILAGSGPGHPDLLTRATHKAILRADLILADKLVPAGVLDLVPRRTPVRIARKFPGNADAAQDELLAQALAGVLRGHTVLRLKQGDPYIYGRGGEEYLFFSSRGLPADRITVLPGLTSALSAPLFAAIPPTQRDVADQVLVCTGTGKKGKPPAPPEFVASRTVVFLMALHRIAGLVGELATLLPHELPPTGEEEEEETEKEKEKEKDPANEQPHHHHHQGRRALWPLSTPCAVVERASCPDQRVIRTTLAHVQEAIESEGSRPPGLLVVGRACETLVQLEKGRPWAVEDGFKGGIDVGGGEEEADVDLDSVVAAAAASATTTTTTTTS